MTIFFTFTSVCHDKFIKHLTILSEKSVYSFLTVLTHENTGMIYLSVFQKDQYFSRSSTGSRTTGWGKLPYRIVNFKKRYFRSNTSFPNTKGRAEKCRCKHFCESLLSIPFFKRKRKPFLEVNRRPNSIQTSQN